MTFFIRPNNKVSICHPFLLVYSLKTWLQLQLQKKVFPISGKTRRKNKYFAIPFPQILVFTQLDNIQDDLSSMTEHYGRLETELQQKDEKLTKDVCVRPDRREVDDLQLFNNAMF